MLTFVAISTLLKLAIMLGYGPPTFQTKLKSSARPFALHMRIELLPFHGTLGVEVSAGPVILNFLRRIPYLDLKYLISESHFKTGIYSCINYNVILVFFLPTTTGRNCCPY